ncbi:hypothetical protein GY45DRAFT_1413969 [Cubamyces sp. BRFM 1775]|nr:hypothetical protein GY45DRAFT_1413969 [Cubamyces sp. BRFM 1775]
MARLLNEAKPSRATQTSAKCEAGFSAIVRGLQRCPHLQYLSLCEMVSTEELNVDEARPAVRGWQEMIELLNSAKNLESLDLADRCLPQPALAALSGLFAAGGVPRLHTLLLDRNNGIEDLSYGALVDAVVHHPSALRLSLAWNNDLESDAVQALSTAPWRACHC